MKFLINNYIKFETNQNISFNKKVFKKKFLEITKSNYLFDQYKCLKN